jgi:predicted DNA-binding transcriptional regulator YafY
LDAVRQATVSAAGGGPTVDADTLTTIAAACRDHLRLAFAYTSRAGGEPSLRRVEPHRLVYTGRRWYLLAWDSDRADWRTFRADRITQRLPAGPRFVPREPPADAATHVVRGTGSLAYPVPARVRLHAPMASLAERLPPAAGLLTPIDAGTTLFETGAESVENLVKFLTSLDVDFDVLDPPALRDRLRELAARYAAAAAD